VFDISSQSKQNTTFFTLGVQSGINGEVKSSKSMLIKTGYPNLLHGCDFLCFNLMNNIINEFENVTGKICMQLNIHVTE